MYVGPEDAGKMFFADAIGDISVTGADSQRVSYINFKSQNDVTLMAAMALTRFPQELTRGCR
ncbi:hypothetical protein GCM10011577_39830 [Pseudarthrobacter polychromogenes]|uniref:Uncharacterized protein n=1 Tax=Pseudarthrobacter polychromogenes TaxID=1676 RepID=A0ABQ1Y3A7_9MICC|nr:hypothetical protein GCM10011577_39830 [Pseudarthrobacter polychromogenes]